MKTPFKNILILLSFFIGISFSTLAQEADTTLTKAEKKALKKEQKAKAKAEKKAQAKAFEELQHQQAIAAIDSQQFVLEANQLYDRRGRTVNVQSNINFIKVAGNTGVLQIGSAQLIGWNGVGGITVDGKISDWKVKKDEKNNRTNVTFNIMGTALVARVTYDLDGTGNFCNVRVNGVFSGRELRMRGILVPNKSSSTYEGMIRY